MASNARFVSCDEHYRRTDPLTPSDEITFVLDLYHSYHLVLKSMKRQHGAALSFHRSTWVALCAKINHNDGEPL